MQQGKEKHLNFLIKKKSIEAMQQGQGLRHVHRKQLPR